MEEKVQRLSEGMDFIEEACGYGEPLEFTEVTKNIISESSDSKASPYKVLGVCKGVFQPIGEFSRNHRLYESNLWPTVLENKELQTRLARRGVFGCLGHADKLVDDRDIQEGKVSHIVTKLEVRENQETHKPFLYGELEILDTPAGRILEAMYRGGADLYVSSRAAGRLIPVPGKDYSLVKPDQFHVHTFDIVCRPGFLQAQPAFESAENSTAVTEAVNEHEKVNIDINEDSNPDLTRLESQVSKLTKILEKVVDDVYEIPEQSSDQTEVNSSEVSEGRQPGESDEQMKQRLHKELVKSADDKADEARKKGDWKEYKKQHDKLGKLDDISPVFNAYDSEDLNKAGIIATLKLLKESNISEEVFSSVIDILKKGIKG